MNNIIHVIRQELENNSDEKTQLSSLHFFKEKIRLYGVKTPIVSRIAKDVFKEVKNKSKKEIFELCEELWQSGYIEESFIACHWSYFVRKDFKPVDFVLFESWVNNYITNWASCDTFCNHTVGDFVSQYPKNLSELKTWARSKNRWMRRASAVSLIIPAKKGEFLKDILEIADILLIDQDDMVQKGYGWMLKAASQSHQKEIFDFVMKRKAIMPRTALRYAIEKMPLTLKEKAMKKKK